MESIINIMDKQKQKLIDWYIDFVETREVYMNYLEEYETFASSILKHTRPILLEHNAAFNYERKGNNREGALTQKDLKQNVAGIHLLLKTIKIRKDIDFSLQIHTYFHELAHLVLNHNDQSKNDKVLSTGQKEYVAETVAQALLYSFCGGMVVGELPSNEKWDQEDYIAGWVRNSVFGKDKIKECHSQIEYAYNKISWSILSKLGKNKPE